MRRSTVGEVAFHEDRLDCAGGGAVFMLQVYGDAKLYLGVMVKGEGAYDPDVCIELSGREVIELLGKLEQFRYPLCTRCDAPVLDVREGDGVLDEHGETTEMLCATCIDDDAFELQKTMREVGDE